MGQEESKMEVREEGGGDKPPISCGEDALINEQAIKGNCMEENLNLSSNMASNNDNDLKSKSQIGTSENAETDLGKEVASTNQIDNVSTSINVGTVLSSSGVSEIETTFSSDSLTTEKINTPEPDSFSRSDRDITNDFKDDEASSTAAITHIVKLMTEINNVDTAEQPTSSNTDLIVLQETTSKTVDEILPDHNQSLDDQPNISEDLKLSLYNDFKTEMKTWPKSKDYELNWMSSKTTLVGKSKSRKTLNKQSTANSSHSARSTSISSISSNETYSSESSLEKIILKLYPKEPPKPKPKSNTDDYKDALLHTNALIFAGSEFLKSFATHGEHCKMGRNLVDLLDTILISIGQLVDIKSKDPLPANIDSLDFNSFHEIKPHFLCTTCHEVVAYKVKDAAQHIISDHQIVCKSGKNKHKKEKDLEKLKKAEAKEEKKRRKKERRAARKEKKIKMLQQEISKHPVMNSNQIYQKQEDSTGSGFNTVDTHEAKEDSPSLRSSSNSSTDTSSIPKPSRLPENEKDRKSSSRSTSKSSSHTTKTSNSNNSLQPQIESKQKHRLTKEQQQNPEHEQQIPKMEQKPARKTKQELVSQQDERKSVNKEKPPINKENQQIPSKNEQQRPARKEELQQSTSNHEKVQKEKNQEGGNQQQMKVSKEPRQRRSKKSHLNSFYLPKKARSLINNNMQQFFIEHVLLSKTLQQLPSYEIVEKQLMDILKEIFPNKSIKLYKFGSRISGTGNRDSDLDIFVDIDNSFNTFELRGSPETIQKVAKLSKALSSSKHFKNQLPITHARVPIVKTTNVQTNIDLDIGFSNSLGFCNTRLVAYYIELQPIARCLCVFMKKWMDRCKLSDILSSYSLVLMVIYFLQVNQLLPSVQKLQTCLPNKFFVGPWIVNCAELPLKEFGFVEVEVNGYSVKLMLQRFFDFYNQFNFEKYVVCPYLGRPNVLIQNIEQMMPQRYHDFVKEHNDWLLEIEDKPMIVQDPFQLNRNLMQRVTKGVMKIFKQYIHESCQCFKEL